MSWTRFDLDDETTHPEPGVEVLCVWHVDFAEIDAWDHGLSLSGVSVGQWTPSPPETRSWEVQSWDGSLTLPFDRGRSDVRPTVEWTPLPQLEAEQLDESDEDPPADSETA